MSLVGAVKSSNAAKSGGESEPTSGSLGMVGFTPVDQPTQRPAKRNADISTLESVKGSLGDDGTNLGSYKDQPADVSGMTGK